LSQTLSIERLIDDQNIGRFNISLLVWCFLAMWADGYEISAMSFAAPELVRQWHVPAEAFKTVFPASNFGVLFGAPLLGYIGDKLGRRIAVVLGSLIFGVFTLAMMWATNLDQMFWLRFLTGIGIGGLMPNTIALNSELAPRRWRATLIVIMFTGITLGSASPGPIAGWLVPDYGWRIVFLIGGVVPLFVAACLWFVLPESVKFLAARPGRRPELLRTVRRMRPDLTIADDAQFVAEATPAAPSGRSKLALEPIFRGGLAFITPLLWICFVTTLMANYFLNNWLPLILEGNGMSPKEAAVATVLYHVGGFLGGILVSVLLKRYGFVAIAVLFALAGPGIAVLGTPALSHLLLSFVCGFAGFTVLGVQFGNNACAGLIYPTEARAQGAGWALGIGRFGSIVGPYLGGILFGLVVAKELTLQQLFAWASLPMAIGCVASILVARLCYLRFRGNKLDDKPAEAEVASGDGVSKESPVRA
jgi:AAHS family 4-hydroxybenzoate transporter-like MFS transporter